jgi:hypothetical protein
MSARLEAALRSLCFFIALGAAGCSTRQVNAVAASPDGRSVIAVGSNLRNDGFGWYYANPLQWYCARNASGRLTCEAVNGQLPK